MKKIYIEGMSCEHCVARVKKALEGAGAKAVEVNLEEKYAEFNAGDLTDEAIANIIEDAGYELVKIE